MINRYIFLCVFVLLTSCVSNIPYKDAVGVYTVVKRLCSGDEISRRACEGIVFFEIVRGNFHRVSADEVAFVIWSGGENLEYNARKIKKSISIKSFPFVINIDKKTNFNESFTLLSNDKGIYNYGRKGALSTLNIRKATLKDLERYNKIYPGNE